MKKLILVLIFPSLFISNTLNATQQENYYSVHKTILDDNKEAFEEENIEAFYISQSTLSYALEYSLPNKLLNEIVNSYKEHYPKLAESFKNNNQKSNNIKYINKYHNKINLIPLSELQKLFGMKNLKNGWEEFHRKYTKDKCYYLFSSPGFTPSGRRAIVYEELHCPKNNVTYNTPGGGTVYYMRYHMKKWEITSRKQIWNPE